MSPKIIMCNYYGMCDENGDAVGHAVKVTNEYSEILKEKYTINLIASPCIVKGANAENFDKIESLKYNININGNSIKKRVVDKFKLLANIYRTLHNDGVCFFYQVDFFFFLYIWLFYRTSRERKLVCLIYHQDFTGGKIGSILLKIYKRALKKIDSVIYTQNGKLIEHKNAMWIPDFFYSKEQYLKYQMMKKTDRVICLGTMNRYKQLEDLVELFSNGSVPLWIEGRFDDQKRYEKLLEMKTENIVIKNSNLEYEEYLEKLACSKYCILPYNMEQYQNRTSGVLLESIYVGSIPIAPRILLEQNRLPGIGYDTLREISDIDEFCNEIDKFDFSSVRDTYDTNKFVEFFDDL